MRVRGRLERLEVRMETEAAAEEVPPMTEAERNRRVQAVLDLYEGRGWRATGDVDADQRFATLLYVMVRIAEREAKEDPTPGPLARAELWRARQALFNEAPLS